MLISSLDNNNLWTLFLVVPYGIGWKTILNENAVEYLTSRNMKLVVIAESPDIAISHPMVALSRWT